MTKPHDTFIHFNGSGHAFGRELGCPCHRCQFTAPMKPAPKALIEFEGHLDPPDRNCTSMTVITEPKDGDATESILVDMGPGTMSSLVASGIPGIENITCVLLTHSHPDHFAPNALGESLRRHVSDVLPVPLFTTRETYETIQPKFKYELNRFFELKQITPGREFELPTTVRTTVLPIEIAHGRVKGACNFLLDCGPRIVIGWDCDLPDAEHPVTGVSNMDAYRRHQADLRNADVYVMPANTYSAEGTGHTSYIAGKQYIEVISPKRVFATHLSGHEDEKGEPGYGWTDAQWKEELSKDGVELGNQGRIVRL